MVFILTLIIYNFSSQKAGDYNSCDKKDSRLKINLFLSKNRFTEIIAQFVTLINFDIYPYLPVFVKLDTLMMESMKNAKDVIIHGFLILLFKLIFKSSHNINHLNTCFQYNDSNGCNICDENK